MPAAAGGGHPLFGPGLRDRGGLRRHLHASDAAGPVHLRDGRQPAARVIGVPVRPILMLQYVLSAVISLVAGLVLAASSYNMDTRIFNLT